jgi:hypothetical protein
MIFMMVFAGCATRHVGIDDQHAVTKHREVLVQQIEYCPKGLPSFLNQLGYRPSKAGDRFTVAQFINGRPATSFDIAVVGPNADFKKPFKVVYEWTGKGFVGGATGSLATLDFATHGLVQQIDNKDAAIGAVVVVLAPVVVGTVGGFIIGVADGIKTTAEEVGKVVLGNYEQVVTYTTYAYDARDRLFLMRMFKADDDQQELVRTEYTYEADNATPVKTAVTTFPDGTVKTL